MECPRNSGKGHYALLTVDARWRELLRKQKARRLAESSAADSYEFLSIFQLHLTWEIQLTKVV